MSEASVEGLQTFCSAFINQLHFETERDELLGELIAACSKVTQLPADEWELTPREAAVLVTAFERWPDGRVDLVYRTPSGQEVLLTQAGEPLPLPRGEMQAVCRAWLARVADNALANAPRLHAARTACLKISECPPEKSPDLTADELDGVRQVIATFADVESSIEAARTLPPVTGRTPLGEVLAAWHDRLGHPASLAISWVLLSALAYGIITVAVRPNPGVATALLWAIVAGGAALWALLRAS